LPVDSDHSLPVRSGLATADAAVIQPCDGRDLARGTGQPDFPGLAQLIQRDIRLAKGDAVVCGKLKDQIPGDAG
jgi:hypothetical protein